MPQTIPDVSQSPETTRDPATVAALLQAAHAYLAAALVLLQCHAGWTTLIEARVQLYLAREAMEAALGDEEPTDA